MAPSRRAIAGVTCLLFVVPVLADLALSGRARAFGYFAPDAFYYLTVARNVVEHGSLSFDQLHGTNGFHPLWQFALAAIWGVGELARVYERDLLILVLLVDLAAITWALSLLARACAGDGDRLSPLFVFVPAGVYSLVLLAVWPSGLATRAEDPQPLYGTLWTYVNGMESALVLLCYAAAAQAFACRRPLDDDREALRFGGLLALMTLARLDHALIAGGVLGELAFAAWRRRDRAALGRLARAGVALALPIAIYCVVNQLVYRSFMPVSGALKSSFPRPDVANLLKLWGFVRDPFGAVWWRSYRVAQMLFPALFAIGFYIWCWRRRARALPLAPIDGFLAASSPGLVALALYDLLYVDLPQQGHWYLPVSTLYVSLVTVRMLGALRLGRALERGRAGAVAAAVCAALVLGGFVRYHRAPDANRKFAEMYFDVGPRLRKRYAERPLRLQEVSDGIVAFSTGFPSMSQQGFTLDPEAAAAFKQGKLQALALARGFDYIASVGYIDPRTLMRSPSPQLVADRVNGDNKHYAYEVELLSLAGELVIVHVHAR
jgi:hypothetical protein